MIYFESHRVKDKYVTALEYDCIYCYCVDIVYQRKKRAKVALHALKSFSNKNSIIQFGTGIILDLDAQSAQRTVTCFMCIWYYLNQNNEHAYLLLGMKTGST